MSDSNCSDRHAPGEPAAPARLVELTVAETAAGTRLDKALAQAAADMPGLSRARITEAIAEGRLCEQSGATVTDARRKVKPGERFRLTLPTPRPARPAAEAITLNVVHEDAHLIVIDKPAGMVVHPAPGAETGTMVNALLAHCGASLVGIGGEARPGIVHRIDKGTSGLIVAAKTEAAHAGLAALFATHDIEREYRALAWGAPSRGDPRLAGIAGVDFEPGGWIRVEAPIARHPGDRKRMAVRPGGRRALTRFCPQAVFGPAERPLVSLLSCRLETGRTHQIRVHAAHIGHALIGDPVYGRARKISEKLVPAGLAQALAEFPRQALHAAVLGFRHPVTGDKLRFSAPEPPDFAEILRELQRITPSIP